MAMYMLRQPHATRDEQNDTSARPQSVFWAGPGGSGLGLGAWGQGLGRAWAWDLGPGHLERQNERSDQPAESG